MSCKNSSPFKPKQNPWMTQELLTIRKQKQGLFAKYKKNPSADNRKKFKTFSNTYYGKIKDAKTKYWNHYFQCNSGNPRQIWKGAKTLLGYDVKQTVTPTQLKISNKTVVDKQEIATVFNNYFSTIGNNIGDGPTFGTNEEENYLNYIPASCHGRQYYFKSVTRLEVLKIIQKLPHKTSHGIDEISNVVLKGIKNEIAGPLTQLINISLITGYIPPEWKTARVLPLFKGGEKDNLTNYRPISLLPSLSKVLERVVYEQLFASFSEKHLSNNQFGFRPKHSTKHAIHNYLQNISDFSEEKYPIGVFLDLKKAFDTVNYEILLAKMRRYEFSQNLRRWIGNYLTERRQLRDGKLRA